MDADNRLRGVRASGRADVETLETMKASVTAPTEARPAGEALHIPRGGLHDPLFRAHNDLGEGLAVIDLRTLRILYANESLIRASGYDEHELVGKPFLNFAAVEVARELHEHVQRRLRGTPVSNHCETTFVHRAGHRIDLEVAVKPIDAEGVRCMVVVARDVTQERFAERAVQTRLAVTRVVDTSPRMDEAASRLLQAIAEGQRWELGAHWRVDARARVLRCATIWRAPGLQAEEFEANCWKTTYGHDVGVLGRAWANGRPVRVDRLAKFRRFVRFQVAARAGFHSALIVPLRAGGRVDGILEFYGRTLRGPEEPEIEFAASLGLQIGQALLAEQARAAAQASEARYRALAETLPEPVLNVDALGMVLDANAAAADWFGVQANDLVGQPLSRLLPEANPGGENRILRWLREPEDAPGLLTFARRRDGTHKPVEVRAAAWNAGDAVHYAIRFALPRSESNMGGAPHVLRH